MTPAQFTLLKTTAATISMLPQASQVSMMPVLEGMIGQSDDIQKLKSFSVDGNSLHERAVDSIAQITLSPEFAKMTQDQFVIKAKEAGEEAVKDHVNALPANQKFEALKGVKELLRDASGNVDQARITKIMEEQLPAEARALPYASQIVDGISDIVSSNSFTSMTEDQFKAGALPVLTNSFRSHLQTLPVDQQYGAFKDVTKVASGFLDPAANAQLTALTEKLDHVGSEMQQALTYAVAENPHFLPYLMDKASNAGAGASSNFMSETLDELFVQKADAQGKPVLDSKGQPVYLAGAEPGSYLLDTQKADAVKNILTEIGNGDMYQDAADFKLLDDVAEASKTLKVALKKPGVTSQEVKDATNDFYTSVQLAGGHISPLATMDFSHMLQFLGDVFDPNVSMDMAISNLTGNLGLDQNSPEAAQMQEAAGMIGGVLELFGGKAGSGGPGDLIRNLANDEYGLNDKLSGLADTFGVVTGGTTATQNQTLSSPAVVGQFNTASGFRDQVDAKLTHIIDVNKASPGGRTLQPGQIRSMLEDIDPLMVEEMKLIEKNPTLKGKFDALVVMNKDDIVDRLAKMHEAMENNQSTYKAGMALGA